MSWQAQTWALRWEEVTHAKITPTAQLLLARMAADEIADAYGHGICVPNPELAADTHQTLRAVYTSLRQLLDAGLIEVAQDQSRGLKMQHRGKPPVVYNLVMSPAARAWVAKTVAGVPRKPRKR